METPGKPPGNVMCTWVQTKHNAFINLYSKNLDYVICRLKFNRYKLYISHLYESISRINA